MKKVFAFSEGSIEMKNLLGGKGANLAEMTRLGLPVPSGFTITTEACMDYLERGEFSEELQTEIQHALKELELHTGKSFNDEQNLLLVSVRSGAVFSMPGMMDTILNLGLNDRSVETLAKLTNDSFFAYDCYRRLLQMFGDVVYGIEKHLFDETLAKLEQKFLKKVTDFTVAELQETVQAFHQLYAKAGKTFPQEPAVQLSEAITAVFDSWNNHRAKVYRQLHHIPDNLGTAVNVQSMVFGNSGNQSGTGVAFTRNPSTGEAKLFGEFLLNAQGEDVVAGIRTPQPIQELAQVIPAAYEQFQQAAEFLENHYKEMQDLEFTIENGQLFILQTRAGKRSAKATVRIAVEMAQEGIISKEEALLRVSPELIDQLLHPIFDEAETKSAQVIANGLPASPGAAVGKVVFTAERAKEWQENGEKVVLMRQETSPEDIEGMVVSEAIVTSRGGMTSHAAVVARGMGTCCVAGCEQLTVNEVNRTVDSPAGTLKEGDVVSVDGSSGLLYLGSLTTQLAKTDTHFEQLMIWADEVADLKVRANAETVQDLKMALSFGATGVGLARTEHMFFASERLVEIRRLILSDDKETAIQNLLRYQTEDFYQMYKITREKPMIVRLLDPPMHEFLPHQAEEIVQLSEQLTIDETILTEKIASLQETNPMLGHRGCRIGVTTPMIYQMQAEAIIRSVIRLKQEGITVVPEIMVPLVAEKQELIQVKAMIEGRIQEIFAEMNTTVDYQIGTMIELPRACLVADQLAEEADFFSFGTNDLTQMTYGFSRDDAGKFLPEYQHRKILAQDPFQSIDQEGVGSLIRMAVEKARTVKPAMKIGVCGEVGGDPASINFFESVGVDYVSCSPYRVPLARLAAAQAKIQQKQEDHCESLRRII